MTIFIILGLFLKLMYLQRAHLLNPMVPGLHSGKMSSSDEGIIPRLPLL
jgi:hypothetical protein